MEKQKFKEQLKVECVGKDGKVKWVEYINLPKHKENSNDSK